MRKKGSLWVSAVLYLALGIIALSLILTAGLPMISKMQDRNTVAQTKDLFYTLNKNILEVANEGPGSKRVLSPFEIKAGELNVDEDNNAIIWILLTKNELIEPNLDINEGPFTMRIEETNIVGEYEFSLTMPYDDIASLNLNSLFTGPYIGKYTVTIVRTGWDSGLELPIVEIQITG